MSTSVNGLSRIGEALGAADALSLINRAREEMLLAPLDDLGRLWWAGPRENAFTDAATRGLAGDPTLAPGAMPRVRVVREGLSIRFAMGEEIIVAHAGMSETFVETFRQAARRNQKRRRRERMEMRRRDRPSPAIGIDSRAGALRLVNRARGLLGLPFTDLIGDRYADSWLNSLTVATTRGLESDIPVELDTERGLLIYLPEEPDAVLVTHNPASRIYARSISRGRVERTDDASFDDAA